MEERQRAKLPSDTLDRARVLRGYATDAERTIWQRLRNNQLPGFKFRRQYPVPPYIADFCCPSARLIVELDGSQHSQHTDSVRTRFLESKGFTVIRFWDNEALQQTDAVMEAIWNACRSAAPHPNPSPVGRGA
ncbi:endonuclease domain-containing protein [Lysobacter soli]|uniref:endonuclease domain-containing protein n=1 Tax=Lysobacter soli TaxID=453783 RepID=UPI00368CC914